MKRTYLTSLITAVILSSMSYSCRDEGFSTLSPSESAEGGFFDPGGFRQPPVISSIVPNTGPVGETIVINGSNFSGVIAYNTVSFNGTAATITEATPSRLVVTVPQNASSGTVSVTSEGFVTQSSTIFQVIAPNTWQFRVSFPDQIERSAAVAFSINGKGYIGTGYQSSSVYRKDFWEYDPKTNALTQKSDFAGGVRMGASGFAIGSKGYVGIGADGTTERPCDFWEYEPTTNQWTRKANFPGTPRSLAGSFSIGNKGYVVAGTGIGSTYFKDCWEYNQDTNQWIRKADFGGSPRYKPVAFPIGVRGYVGGGSNTLHDFWEYHPVSNTWTRKADIPGATPTTGFGCNMKGFVGMAAWSANLWQYDPGTNVWQSKAAYPGMRAGGSAFVIGKWGYFVLGSDQDNSYPYGAYIHRYIVE